MNVDEFLGFYFPGVNPRSDKEAVAIGGDRKSNTSWAARRWQAGKEPLPVGRLYFCISTVRVSGPRDQHLTKGAADLIATYVIGLDDIGTKFPVPALPPTTVIETSLGNFQYFYRLRYPADPDKAAALIRGLAIAKMTDAGAGRADRYLRVPGSINTKRSPPFVARVVEHHPDRAWSLAELEVAFGVAADAPRKAASTPPALPAGQVDPLFEWLLMNGDVDAEPDARGWHRMTCPWEDGHSPGPGATKGTDYHPGAPGGFSCLHEHCIDRRTSDLRAWVLEQDPAARLGPEAAIDMAAAGSAIRRAMGQQDESDLNEQDGSNSSPGAQGESVVFLDPIYSGALSPALRLAHHIRRINLGPGILPEPNRGKAEQPLLKQPVSHARVHAVMRAIGLEARLNMMTFEVEATLAGFNETVPPDVMLDNLVHACTRCGMTSETAIRQAAASYAMSQPFHPVLEWIDSGPGWDGVDRIDALAATLEMRDPGLSQWRDIVVRLALIQAMVAMTNWQRPVPADVGYCMVLQGPQDIGKSLWVKHAMLPSQWVTAGMTLKLDHHNERDIVRRATQTPIVELGEVDATFKKSDVSGLKNFLTTPEDIYREPWGRGQTKRPRCTVYFPTVNPQLYLVDQTGDRRFRTLAVKACHWQRARDTIDQQQLWMQAAIMQEEDPRIWLTREESQLHSRISRAHQSDSDANLIIEQLEWRRQGKAEDDTWVHATAKQLLEHFVQRDIHVSRVELNAKLSTAPWTRYVILKGARGWMVPPFRTALTSEQQASTMGIRVIKRDDKNE